MRSNGQDVSLPYFAWMSGLGGLMTGIVTGIILLIGDKLDWRGLGTCSINCLVIGVVLGFVVGSLYRGLSLDTILGGSKPIALVLTVLMLTAVFGGGIVVAMLTAHHGGGFVWTWGR